MPAPKKSISEGNPANQQSVLLIHPDIKFLAKYQEQLESLGYAVTVANDGSEGMKKLYQGFPDIVVADIMLPEINGYQICRLMKNDPVTKRIPFVLVSDFDEKMEKFWGIKAGADLFLHYDELDVKLARQIKILVEMYGQVDAAEKQTFIEHADSNTYGLTTRLNQILDKALIESTLMIDFRNLVDLAHDPNLLNHMLFSFLEGLLDYDAAAILYNDKSKVPRLLTFHLPEGQTQHPDRLEAMKNEFFAGLPQKYLDLPIFQMQDVEIIGMAEDTHEPVNYQTAYFKEFFYNGELIGALTLYAKEKVDYPKIFPVGLIEDEIGLLMKVRHVFSQAEMLAVTDGLTGLANYNQFMMTLEREFKASKRYEHPLSIAIIDIDNFKEYNAQWGYLQGDEVLKLVAGQAEQTFRAVDVVARIAGEEMVVLFPKTDHEHAMLALERFQMAMSKMEGALSPITVSMGLATLDPASESIQNASDFLKSARAALDTATQKGTNQIAFS